MLFMIYINSFLDKFDESTLVNTYVDALAIAINGKDKDQVAQSLDLQVRMFCLLISESQNIFCLKHAISVIVW